MPLESINVLIADDSGFMQLLIKSILNADKRIKVIATANNGKEAFELTKSRKPDVVLMDILMPDYDGLFGIKKIMKYAPTPIVILSTLGNTNIEPIVESLNLGAVDYINKPAGGHAKLRTVDADIVKLVRYASTVDASRLHKNRIEKNHRKHTFARERLFDIVVIGSSTGGPNALETVVNKFPNNLEIPVLIIQHMPPHFIESLAKRLNNIVPQEVIVANEGTELKGGKIYMAPGGKNIVLSQDKVTGSVRVVKCRRQFAEYNNPSINSVMLSVAKIYKERAIGVILTGMGKDGADGIDLIHKNGGYTIAQDKGSSVVFGMPKEAITRNSVKRIVPVDEIGEFIISCIS